jgi:hypothetical protein
MKAKNITSKYVRNLLLLLSISSTSLPAFAAKKCKVQGLSGVEIVLQYTRRVCGWGDSWGDGKGCGDYTGYDAQQLVPAAAEYERQRGKIVLAAYPGPHCNYPVYPNTTMSPVYCDVTICER